MRQDSKEKLEKMKIEAEVMQLSEYEHPNIKIKWKCKNSHEFERSYASASKHSLKCPICYPKIPHNKGKIGVSKETSQKMRSKKIGIAPHNKGQEISYEQRVKLSAINRGISIDDFDDFTTEESKRLRNKFSDMGLSKQCFENNNFTCECCGVYGTSLNAHHKNSWKFFENERFDLDNLACLCDICHDEFHSIYGNGKKEPNTKEQYLLFLKSYQIRPKNIILLTGAPGSGKSWVASQINNVHHCPMDEHKKDYLQSIRNVEKIVLTDITATVSTWFSRLRKAGHNVELIIIDEDRDTIISRISNRGGVKTKSIDARIKRMKSLSDRASFVGTAAEVLDYLNKKVSEIAP